MQQESLKLFNKLYDSGVRFIKKEDYNSTQNGLFQISPTGNVKGRTLKSLIDKQNVLKIDNKYLNKDETERAFNFVAFQRMYEKGKIQ